MDKSKTVIISHLTKEQISPKHFEYFGKQVKVVHFLGLNESLGLFLAKEIRKHKILLSQTDTLPGFLAQSNQKNAFTQLQRIKKRTLYKKLIILAADLQMALSLSSKGDLNPKKINFCKKNWPGPVTIILPLSPDASILPSIGPHNKKNNFAVRVPEENWLRTMITKLKNPLFAPSANISDLPLPGSPLEMFTTFNEDISLFHFFHSAFGKDQIWTAKKPSTIVDVTGIKPLILREGAISTKKVFKRWQES